MARIYLSSTYADLVACREAVYDILRQGQHDVTAMEDYVATDERPLEKCLADVASCDIYVGLFAWRYGFVPPGQQKSITELEYLKAHQAGLPCLLFLAAEDAPWPPNRMDPDLKAIKTLRAALRLKHIVSFFKTPADLAGIVSVAVMNALEQLRSQPSDQPSLDRDFARKSLEQMSSDLEPSIRLYWNIARWIFAVGVVLLLLGAFLDKVILGIGGILISVLALIPLATMFSTRKKKAILGSQARALRAADANVETIHTVQRFLTHQLAA